MTRAKCSSPILPLLAAALLFASGANAQPPSPEVIRALARQAIEASGVRVNSPSATEMFPTDGSHFYSLEIGNGVVESIGGKRTWLVELRGWLSVVPNCNGADPDWHYDLEVDADWAHTANMPLSELLRVGSMIEFVQPNETGDSSFRTILGVPKVHVELNGAYPSSLSTLPNGWSEFGRACDRQVGGNPGLRENALWPFDPLNPLSWQPQLYDGAYVRMYGALVTDNPHDHDEMGAQMLCTIFKLPPSCNYGHVQKSFALQRWSGNRTNEDPANPSRWTEMHPPNIIAILPDRAKTITLKSLLVSADNCFIFCDSSTIEFEIQAPSPQPPGTEVAYIELVNPATNFQTITEGHQDNAGQFNGAFITTTPAGILVRVAVQGKQLFGAPGRFGALYQVFWKTKPPVSSPTPTWTRAQCLQICGGARAACMSGHGGGGSPLPEHCQQLYNSCAGACPAH